MPATQNKASRLSRRIRILIALVGWVGCYGLYADPSETGLIESHRAVRLPDDPHLWYDLRELEIEGKGWQDTEQFYDRLPDPERPTQPWWAGSWTSRSSTSVSRVMVRQTGHQGRTELGKSLCHWWV